MKSKLFNEVVQLIDLPSNNDISCELELLLKEKGFDPDILTLEELRQCALLFLEDVFATSEKKE
ncbi:MAG: hypothetical protein HYS98_04390 [Deltaproteobacteria bacterium]|nr:hypothetical protein [Deltaproteobacteria bacterium]